MKGTVKEVVKEAVEEASASTAGAGPGASKGRKKKGPATEFDSTRRQGADPRDSRSRDDTWPCLGLHVGKGHGNRHGRWEECERCGLCLR